MHNYIYVVFSTTPYKMGTFIRKVTRSRYNHISIAFDRSLYEMYSFARYYKNTPFYGGFVRESASRYFNGKRCADVMVCRVPVTKEQFELAREYINRLLTNRENYRYNLVSAIFYPLHKRINIKDSYTCVEFAVELFRYIGYDLGLKEGKFCSTKKLASILDEFSIYTGKINKLLDNVLYRGDPFIQKKGFWEGTKLTVVSNGKLIKRMFTKK